MRTRVRGTIYRKVVKVVLVRWLGRVDDYLTCGHKVETHLTKWARASKRRCIRCEVVERESLKGSSRVRQGFVKGSSQTLSRSSRKTGPAR